MYQRHLRSAAVTIVALGIFQVALDRDNEIHDDHPTVIRDVDGTLHLSRITIPPSDLLSDEFKQLLRVGWAGSKLPQTPSKGAPKYEWDKFDAEWNDLLERLQPQLSRRYPTSTQEKTIGGVHVGVVTPKGAISEGNLHRVLLNLHGGGFYLFRGLSLGKVESAPVASIAKIKVVTVDYRQSPYHHYPAASEDVEIVYKELLKQYKAGAIGIYGCAAGGFLTAQVVARLQAKGLPQPGAIAMFCGEPPIMPGASSHGGDSSIWRLGVAPLDRWYMDGTNINDPQAFPGSSDAVLTRFPPTLLVTGTRDYDLSPTVVTHARLLRLGVDAQLYVIEGASHALHIFAIGTPETHDAYTHLAAWFDKHLQRS